MLERAGHDYYAQHCTERAARALAAEAETLEHGAHDVEGRDKISATFNECSSNSS